MISSTGGVGDVLVPVSLSVGSAIGVVVTFGSVTFTTLFASPLLPAWSTEKYVMVYEPLSLVSITISVTSTPSSSI